jgi:MipA family protein
MFLLSTIRPLFAHGLRWTSASARASLAGAGCVFIVSAHASVAGQAVADTKDAPRSNWEVTVGGGAAVAPKYEGSKDLEVSPVPFLSVVYGERFFIGTDKGLGAKIWSSDDFNLAVAANYAGGRKRKDGPLLRALDEIDTGVSLNVSASYTVFQFLSFSAGLTRDFGAGDGLQAQFGVDAVLPVSDKLSFTAGASTTWADDQYMKTYFGISTAASLRSGLRAFHADAGFKRVDFNIGAAYLISDRWTLTGQVGVGLLLGDAADSPIVEKDTQPFGVVGLGYRF